MKVYGYVRVSTLEQNKERQIENILKNYPEAIIMSEEYTGKTMDRPVWSKLYPKLKSGDMIVFDEVSRMSRNSEEGFRVYQELYERGCELVFLKEPHISTASYREALEGSINVDVNSGDNATDELISSIMNALNTFMMEKVKSDIKRAFEQSQAETDLRAQRAAEGISEAKKHNAELEVLYPDSFKEHPEYSNIGREKGDKLSIKKMQPIMELIREYSKDFNGTLNDKELLAVLSTKTVKIPNRKRSGKVEDREISAKLARNTLYKYKRMMKETEPEPERIQLIIKEPEPQEPKKIVLKIEEPEPQEHEKIIFKNVSGREPRKKYSYKKKDK